MKNRMHGCKGFIYFIVCYPIFGALLFAGCASAENAAPGCQRWLSETIVHIEGKPVAEGYRGILQAVSIACPEIHASMQLAAAEALKDPDSERRAVILGKAAKPFLPPDPSPFASYEKAYRLAKLHPLTIAEDVSDGLLQNIDAGTYIFAWALEHRLIEIKSYNLDGRKLILIFLLSAATLHDAK